MISTAQPNTTDTGTIRKENTPDSNSRSKVHCGHNEVESLGVGVGTNRDDLPHTQLSE